MSADDASITIKSGDTLSQRTVQYNREHGTNYTWQEVAEYNNLANPHLIHPGDVITFPSAPVQPAQPAPTVSAPSVPQLQAPKPSVPTPVYSAPAVSTGTLPSPSNGSVSNSSGTSSVTASSVSSSNRTSIIDQIQTVLDIIGFIPGLGDACDFANGVISLTQGDYVTAGMSFISMVPIAGDALGKGSKIARFGLNHADKAVDSYKALRKIANKGDEVHHLIEKRLVRYMGIKPSDMPSIILSKEEHRVFTNRWRNQIAYGSDYRNLNPDSIMEIAKKVYYDCPELFDACWDTFKGVK